MYAVVDVSLFMICTTSKMCESSRISFTVLFWIGFFIEVLQAHPKNLAWSGGPLHCECEHGIEVWTKAGKYVKNNVIAVKAVSFNDEIYVISPR